MVGSTSGEPIDEQTLNSDQVESNRNDIESSTNRIDTKPDGGNKLVGLDTKIVDRLVVESRSKPGSHDGSNATEKGVSEDATTRTVDFSTEPITEESKVFKEYKSVSQTVPFLTTTRGNNVITTTTSRSTKVEHVSVFTEKDDEEDESEEDEGSEEVKEKKKKVGKESTTLRTGKILAAKQPYDASPNARKSAFQHHDYNFDSYPINSGGYRKPVTSYYDGSNGRKPPQYDRKPLYEFDSNYGGGNGRRPPNYDAPSTSRRPVQDFSIGLAGKNPFLDGSSTPGRRPYAELSTTLKNPSFGTTFPDGISNFRKPTLSAFSEPFTTSRRPVVSGVPDLEGGFKPILASNYNELPSQQQQPYRQKVKPQRVPGQSETTQSVPPTTGGGLGVVNAGGNGFNFNNIGKYKFYYYHCVPLQSRCT